MSHKKNKFKFDPSDHGDDFEGHFSDDDFDVAPSRSPTSLGAVFGEALSATASRTDAKAVQTENKKAQQLKKAVAAAAAAERKASAAASAAVFNPFQRALDWKRYNTPEQVQNGSDALFIIKFLKEDAEGHDPMIPRAIRARRAELFEKAMRLGWMPEIDHMRATLSQSKKGGYRNKSHKKHRSHKKRRSHKTRR